MLQVEIISSVTKRMSISLFIVQVMVCEDNQRKAFFVMHGKCRGGLDRDIDYNDICETITQVPQLPALLVSAQ